ncbi:MAG: alpha/beta hydrolase [Pseudomonadota bacterium]
MRAGFALDALLYRGRKPPPLPQSASIATPLGPVRVLDTGGSLPPVVLVPDGPNLIEHYATLVERLRAERRVVVLDLPGFGFSFPQARYEHRLEQGGAVILAVLAALDLRVATLVCTCVNGFYAIAAARLDADQSGPARIARLVLAQTPSLADMRGWTHRIVPRVAHLPVLGQLLHFSQRRRVAMGWYHAALARREDRPRFKETAAKAFDAGACFCLPSVVQGVSRESEWPELLQGVTLPTTLVWGAADRSHKPSDPAGIRRHLPQAVVLVWAHCGHFPDLEDEAAFAALLLGSV